MTQEKQENVSLRIDPDTRRELERLAKITDRNRSSVIRRLILAASTTPGALEALGLAEQQQELKA